MTHEHQTKFENKFSAYQLGQMYEFGRADVAIDLDKANYWYQRSYKNEVKDDALLALARIALHKKEQPKLAYAIYEKLSSKNIPEAHLGLGEVFESGSLGVQDIKKARKSYRKAYDLGSLNAYASYMKLGFHRGSGNNLSRRIYCFFTHCFTLKKVTDNKKKSVYVVRSQKSMSRKPFKSKVWFVLLRLPGFFLALVPIIQGWTIWQTGNIYVKGFVFDAGGLAQTLSMILILCGFYMLFLAIKSLTLEK
jgi:tetratricopeptide (TPR) repeat protein